MNKGFLFALIIVIIFGGGITFYLAPITTSAHPGRTDSSGCHTCKTNCPSYGLSYGEYHCTGGSGVIIDPPPPPQPVIEYKTESQKEVIVFVTKYENDSTLDMGQNKVKQEGVNGEKTLTYKVTYTDGKETNREKTNESITTNPIDKVIQKGTKPKAQLTNDTNQNTMVKGSATVGFLGLLFIATPFIVLFYVLRHSKKK